jgi:hypothetical protein
MHLPCYVLQGRSLVITMAPAIAFLITRYQLLRFELRHRAGCLYVFVCGVSSDLLSTPT